MSCKIICLTFAFKCRLYETITTLKENEISGRKQHHVWNSVKINYGRTNYTPTYKANTCITPWGFRLRLSEIADKIHDNNQDHNVYATSYNIINNHARQVLLQGMANLSLQVQSLVKFQTSQYSHPDRTCSQRKSQSRLNSFSRERRTYNTYWYHFKFGYEARK